MSVWTDSTGAEYIQVEGYCEHGNEPLGSIKGGGFLDYQVNCQLSSIDSAPRNPLVSHVRVCKNRFLSEINELQGQ
jgi:hypothetical protein